MNFKSTVTKQASSEPASNRNHHFNRRGWLDKVRFGVLIVAWRGLEWVPAKWRCLVPGCAGMLRNPAHQYSTPQGHTLAGCSAIALTVFCHYEVFFNLAEAIPMTIRPHAPAWYDRLSTLQHGYFYPWKSRLPPLNGEDAYLDLVHRHLTSETDVLDVGCGHGEVALELSPHCQSILAYDRVENYIQIAQESARKKNAENVTYLCFDSSHESNNGLARIPAEPQSFDLMISRRGPLHWLEDARRVARPGATLIQLNPMETPLPQWANLLPEPLRSATGIEYPFGMLNSVKYHLQLGGLELHSAWTYDVPEFFADPHELYMRLSWGYIPEEVPSWSDVKSIIEQIFTDYSTEPDGLAMRHTRLLWMAFVNTKQ